MFLLFAALSSAAPVSLTWQGRALDAAGQPINASSATVLIQLFDAPGSVDAVHEQSVTTDLVDGYFAVKLTPDSADLGADSLFVDLVLNDVLLVDRDPLGVVPRAATALSVPTPYAVPVGGLIPWWRPDTSVPLPDGYAIADGSVIADHGFPIDGPVTLPDLRNRFILGASTQVPDGQSAPPTDGPEAAPGIGGVGGENALRSLGHDHRVSLSSSTGAAGTHTHTVGGGTNNTGGHGHRLPFGDAGDGLGWQRNWPRSGTTTRDLRLNGYVDDRPRGGNVASYQSATAGSHEHTVSGTAAAGGEHGHTVSVEGTTQTAAPEVDVRPAYVGMLYLMRIQ